MAVTVSLNLVGTADSSSQSNFTRRGAVIESVAPLAAPSALSILWGETTPVRWGQLHVVCGQ
ncbi:hypothetical protein D3C85_1716760 [compost metagenome]